MNMYAIIETGGKQYRVNEGDTISVEKLVANEGDSITFDRVLFIGGDSPKVGAPVVDGASVTGKVVAQVRDKKVIVYKYKPKKGFHKKNGHRQPKTKVLIEKISG